MCWENPTRYQNYSKLYPDKRRGPSARSVRRYISDHNLKAISKRDNEVAVEEAVQEKIKLWLDSSF